MSESAIRTQIAAILNTVPDIGRVHDYRRSSNNWKAFLDLFRTNTGDATEKILGWMVSRKSASEDRTNVKPHIFRIEGIMGVQDSAGTEKTFNTLIETVCQTFRSNKTLNSAALGHSYIQLVVSEERMFGTVLCHFCELNLTVQDYNIY